MSGRVSIVLSSALIAAVMIIAGLFVLTGEDVSADTPETGIPMSFEDEWMTAWETNATNSPWTYEITGTILTLKFSEEKMTALGAHFDDPDALKWLYYEMVGDSPWKNNTTITEVRIGPGFRTMCEGFFYGCSGITTVTTVPGEQYDEDASISFYSAFGNSGITALSFSLGTVTFDLSGSNFGTDNDYTQNNTLTSIDLTGCTYLDNNSFRNCVNLTSVTGLSSLEDAGPYTFAGCTKLTSIPVFGPNFKEMPEKMFYASGLTAVDLSGTAVEKIGNSALMSCMKLETVNLGNVKEIDTLGLASASKLKSISSDSLLKIGERAFVMSKELESVSFPNVTSIGNSAFSGDDKLKTVNIPNAGVIDSDAFFGCYSIEELSFPNAWDIRNNAFRYTDDPYPSEDSSLKTIEIPSAMKIGNGAFANCSALETVTIGKSVMSIGTDVFEGTTASFEIVDPVADKIDEQATVIENLNKQVDDQAKLIKELQEKMSNMDNGLQNKIDDVKETTASTSSDVSGEKTLSYVVIACSVVSILLLVGVLVLVKKSKP